MPNDEDLDYLVTQAVADFLANGLNPPIDGIIYRSVQREGNGRNVVLFHQVAKVARFDRPPGTEVSVSLGHREEEEWVEDYEVIEQLPSEQDDSKPLSFDETIARFSHFLETVEHDDGRGAALVLDRESIRVHRVEWAEFKTSPTKVSLMTWTKRDDLPF